MKQNKFIILPSVKLIFHAILMFQNAKKAFNFSWQKYFISNNFGRKWRPILNPTKNQFLSFFFYSNSRICSSDIINIGLLYSRYFFLIVVIQHMADEICTYKKWNIFSKLITLYFSTIHRMSCQELWNENSKNLKNSLKSSVFNISKYLKPDYGPEAAEQNINITYLLFGNWS